MREPHIFAIPERDTPGITPACAGTTKSRNANVRHSKDHPRVCGNHRDVRCFEIADVGSPPRVREPPVGAVVTLFITGITPACAGTTKY